MIEIKSGTLEEKIIKVIQHQYPITIEELRKKIGISKKILEMEIKKLQSKQIILLEPLPDRVYIRLARTDFHFIGRQTQQRFVKRKSGKKNEKEEYDGVMFG